MSRKQVRDTVHDWFDPAGAWATATPGPPNCLDKVYRTFPKILDFKRSKRLPNQRTRCVVVVFLPRHRETRESFGGDRQGWKSVVQDVVLQGFVESYEKPDDMLDVVDDLAEALIGRARADHTFGKPSSEILLAAEAQIASEFGEPFTPVNAAATQQWFQITFTVTQFVMA